MCQVRARVIITANGTPLLPGLLQCFERALTTPDATTSKPDAPSMPSTQSHPEEPLRDRLRVPVGGVGSGDLYPAGLLPSCCTIKQHVATILCREKPVDRSAAWAWAAWRRHARGAWRPAVWRLCARQGTNAWRATWWAVGPDRSPWHAGASGGCTGFSACVPSSGFCTRRLCARSPAPTSRCAATWPRKGV